MSAGSEQRSAVLEGQKRALELAMHGAPITEVLGALVRAIEVHSGDDMTASILLVVDGRLRHGAAPGLADSYNALVDGLPIGPDQASCGSAAYFGVRVSIADISTDPRWASYRSIAAQYGLAACWSMPIRSPEGEVVGTFAHYYPTVRDPAPRDVEAVEWIANTAGLVIARHHQARQRREAELALAAARDDLERRVAGLHLVHELAIGLHAPANLQPALDVALDVAIQLHRARHGVLFLYTDDALRIAAARGFDGVPEELLARLARDVERHAGQRYIIADTEHDERYAGLVELSRWVGVRAVHRTPIRTRSGRLLGVLIVHLELPRAPMDLEMQLTDLCVRYAGDAIERTHAAAEIQRAKDAAEQANRAKDEFLAVLGHELRNPLAPIASAVHLLDVRTTDERARAAREVIERQLGHLTRLVDDLLDISRIRQGRLELERAPLEVHEVIARAVEMTAAMFVERRHTIVVFDAPGLRVHGDATRLAQVISNLLVNAAKYSNPGKTTTITATRVGPSVEIAVADQGVGLAPEMLPRVFELFAQEERSLDRAQGGLGLGLAIVRKLVVLHGGSVRAHSDGVGRGSTFTVSLPAIDGGAPREPAPRRAARRSERPRRILVVDDNVDVADMMAELLEEMGHVVRTANDGETALAVVPQFAPEVALLDLGLPVMDGLELARKLRAAPGCPFLVAVTGYGRGSDQERAKEAGFDAHLVKPVSVETVLRVIDGVPAA